MRPGAQLNRHRRGRDEQGNWLGSNTENQRLWLNDDAPITTPARGRFELDRVAQRVAERLGVELGEPATMVVVGALGAGKTSLLQLVRHHLVQRRKPLELVSVSLWKYESSQAAASPVYAPARVLGTPEASEKPAVGRGALRAMGTVPCLHVGSSTRKPSVVLPQMIPFFVQHDHDYVRGVSRPVARFVEGAAQALFGTQRVLDLFTEGEPLQFEDQAVELGYQCIREAAGSEPVRAGAPLALKD